MAIAWKHLACLFFAAASPLPADDAPWQRVDDELAGIIADERVPGIAAAAVRNGEIVAAGAAGVRKSGHPEPVRLTDRFHLGSCTKSMTAALAHILARDGGPALDTTCREAFPDLDMHAEYESATLTHFLTNTGGAPTDVPPDLWKSLRDGKGTEVEQRMRLVRGILAEPPAYRPGQGSAYSNAGFSIAGAMLERHTGTPYADLLRTRLFEPLGMDSAGFGPPATPGEIDAPYGHVLRDERLLAIDPGPLGDNPPAITPAGRVHASILDFAKYAAFHLGHAEDVPLDAADLAALHETTAASGDYARGWVRGERDWAGGPALTHTGSNTMFYAVIWLAPGRDFAAVAACNAGHGFPACDAAVAMLVERVLGPAEAE